jgi:hypothetical protein
MSVSLKRRWALSKAFSIWLIRVVPWYARTAFSAWRTPSFADTASSPKLSSIAVGAFPTWPRRQSSKFHRLAVSSAESPSLNPSGKAKPADQMEWESLRVRVAELEARERARESAAVDSAGGVVTAARMRKVLGQDPVLDCGPTEQRLREWLSKDVAKYETHVRELEAKEGDSAALKAENVRLEQEIAELRKQSAPEDAEDDQGSARATALIDRIFDDLDQQAMEEQQRFLKDGLCVACGNKPIPDQGEAGRVLAREVQPRTEK